MPPKGPCRLCRRGRLHRYRPARGLWGRARRLGERLALGHPRSGRDRDARPDRPRRPDGDAGARPRAGHRHALRRSLRAVDRRRRGRRLEAARLVLVPERHRGRPERSRLPSAPRRRRVVGLPLVGGRDARARRRRRVSGALPARVRRAAATGRRALRARVGERRPRDRAPPERRLGPARFGPRSEGRECVLHSKRHAAVLGFAPRGRRLPPARRSSSSSPATPSGSHATRGDSASATRCREPGPCSRPPRFAGCGRADRRPRLGRGRDRRRPARPLPQGTAQPALALPRGHARIRAHRIPAQPARRALRNATSSGRARRFRSSATST